MRVNLGFLGFMLAGSTVLGFAACGTSVSEITGGTGGSGSTGTVGNGGASTAVSSSGSTSTSTSTSTTSTSTSTSTSSTGGGDICMEACAHIVTCVGFDVCAQGLKLDCTVAQYECAAKCINALDCGSLTIQAGQACLSQCAPQDAGPPLDGGDPCTNACGHVQQCLGFDACALLGMQLDCSTPQNACIADCVSGTQCSQLSQQTFQACQAQCQGPPPGPDAGSAMACQQCSTQSCGAAVGACGANMACQGWLGCVGACQQGSQGPQCYFSCDMQFAGAAALYNPVYACSCSSCSTACSAIDPCAHVPDAGP